jgi:hypothetical protein
MSLKKVFFVICIGITALFLGVGFGIAGKWILALIAILIAPAWLFARKYAHTWLPFICLLTSVGLAVVGILIGASSLWMFLGSGFSLAVWDLLLFSAALENNPSGEQARLYEIKHIQSLVLALGFGLLLLFLGRLFTLQIPFPLLILFVTSVLFGLDRTLGDIKKQRVRR